jgi:hypothetical protein
VTPTMRIPLAVALALLPFCLIAAKRPSLAFPDTKMDLPPLALADVAKEVPVSIAPLLNGIAAQRETPEPAVPVEGSPEPAIAAEVKSIEFAGYVSFAKDPLFVLYDGATKESSPWMAVGQRWHGWVIASFNSQTERLILRSEKAELNLNLRSSHVGKALLLPALLAGSYTLRGGMVVYGSDARLGLADGTMVSSPNGIMISDEDQKFIGGDLLVETAGGTKIRLTNALMDVDGRKTTAKQLLQVK